MRIACLLLVVLFAWGGAFAALMPSNTLYLDSSGRAESALASHRARMAARAQGFARYRQALAQRRLISPKTVLPRQDTFIVTGTAGRALPVTRAATYGNGALTFAYSGWTSSEEAALRAFLDAAYPVLVNIYGAPATTATLTLVKGGIQTGIEGGEFDPVAMRLTVEPLPEDFTTGDGTQYGFNLLHLVLHAFHTPALIGYDAWEEGLAWAGAAVAMTLVRPNPEDFSLVYSFNYLLPLYDRLNQESLAAPSFFSPQGMSYMSLWRVGMAMSAWLKVYAEVPDPAHSAFKEFNTAYYASYSTSPAVAGNLASLKGIMAGVTPSVEGTPFATWYDRQHVLRPVTQAGAQSYLFAVPLENSISLMVHYYQSSSVTTGSGVQVVETPLAGTVDFVYRGYDGIELVAEEGNTLTIATGGDFPGIGFLIPSFMNIGEDEGTGSLLQRVRLTGSLGGKTIDTYFPYMGRGDSTNESEFFGPMIGADTGAVSITVPGILSYNTAVIQGVFAQQAAMGDLPFFAPATFVYTPTSGTPSTFRRNIGPGFYEPVLVVENQQTTLTHTFFSGLAMVAFPLTPTEVDAATLFGYQHTPEQFNFATWDPTLPGTDKYRRYPATPPITPGEGYWLNLPTHRTVEVTGAAISDTDTREITLAPGWNMIGNTFNASLDPWEMTVDTGTTSYALRDAIRVNGLIGPVWTYNSDGYYEVKPSLTAWEGGWINNMTTSPIIIRQQGASRAARAAGDDAGRVLREGGWGMQLQVRTPAGQDRAAYLGISSGARQGMDGLDWVKPPAAGKGVRIAFIHPDRQAAGAAYASDIRGEVGLKGEAWEFEVRSDTTGTVTLNWPDLRNVPAQYQVVLDDLTTGTRQYLRTTAAYQYQATGMIDQADTRRFRLTVAPRANAPVAFLNVQTQPTRGGGVSVHVTLSGAAELLMEVRSPTGKLVRTIRVPAARANEPVLVGWNGRGVNNKLVPSGAYMLVLTARTAEGFAIRRNEMVSVRQ